MTDHKLRLIPGPAKREPTPAMLELAESLLERVKDGELVALVVVAAGADGGTRSSLAIDNGAAPVALIGELTVIQGLVRHEIDLRRNIPRG
jgi:hypothetical protein